MKNKRNFSLNLKANPSRNVFDRSYRVNMVNNLGSIRPFLVKEVVAGSKVQLGVTSVTRLESMRGPSFARMHEHFDYFFVPFSQLWRPWEQFRTRQSHFNSHAIAAANNDVIPFACPSADLATDVITPICSRATYNASNNTLGVTDIGVNDVRTCNQFGFDGRSERLMLLHMLGYSAFLINNSPGTTIEALDNAYQTLSESTDELPLNARKVNFFRLAAYQKIYYDYYRNEKYEKNRLDAYNLDSVADDGDITAKYSVLPFTQLQYRWKKKDYFMSVTPDVMPAANYIGFEGFVNSAMAGFGNTVNSGEFPQLEGGTLRVTNVGGYGVSYGTNDAIQPNYGQENSTQGDQRGSVISPTTGGLDISPLNGSVSVQNLKLMFAREKLLKRMYNAKNNYSSQMLAIFGFSPNTMRTDMVYHIGGASHRLIIDDAPVYNSNSTGTFTNTGTFTGRLRQYGAHPKCAEFQAQEDGIIMGLHSISIENDYASLGIDRDNLKLVPEDFFYQEYENLGRAPLYAFELNSVLNTDSAKIVGFIDRYSEYKTSYDKIFAPFINKSENQYDAVYNYARYAAPTNIGAGNQSPTVTDSDVINERGQLYYQTMLINPNTLLNAVGVRYNGFPSTTPFIINLYNTFKCIAPMQNNSF